MKNKKFIGLTAIFAVAALLLTRIIWPDPVGAVQPSGNLLPFFIIINLFECIAFGMGIAYLITEWASVKMQPWVHGSVIWLLISWWPHDSLHRISDEHNFMELLKLEYGFHVTLMIAGFILVSYLIKTRAQVSAAV